MFIWGDATCHKVLDISKSVSISLGTTSFIKHHISRCDISITFKKEINLEQLDDPNHNYLAQTTQSIPTPSTNLVHLQNLTHSQRQYLTQHSEVAVLAGTSTNENPAWNPLNQNLRWYFQFHSQVVYGCILGKMHALPNPRFTLMTAKLQLIYSDICGTL